MKRIEVITTHVNADFDGIGAMIGAKKLYPDACLVFPGSQEKAINEDFVQSVLQSLDVEKAKNIDRSAVGRLVIVDTRSPKRIGDLEQLLTGKGSEVIIFDHHPLQPGDIEPDKLYEANYGSTTTIITLMLKENGLLLTKEEATVMLAGIYEDTGNLTYTSTRVEDMEAAAWLLSMGAMLDVVKELVKREISKEQIRLLNEMLGDLRVYAINGYDIGMTIAASEDYFGDFSLLVEKVKTMENLPALFGMGSFGDKVYIAARSSVEDINVGEILRIFNGGGHSYAASATVKDLTVFQVVDRLLAELREKIRKPKVARDIMSLPVKYVTPDATVEESKELLTRYNINMVPVCEKKDGKVKITGLISRQNLSKAVFHGFSDNPVKDFMTTEFFSVTPDAKIAEIKELIFRGRQRLLPVVNENEEPVGVVTRTDFLRIMQDEQVRVEETETAAEDYSKNIAGIMRNLIEPVTFERLVRIGDAAGSMGYNAYLVGGIVRDLVLRKTNSDVDIVIEGDGIKLVNTIAKSLNAKVTEHRKFGTAQLYFSDGKKIDIATARIEFYESPASLPTVEKGSLKLDLYRRDFTINTLSIKLNPGSFGEMIDFFGGLRDIKEGMIRIIHNLSFVEDPTRIFRAVRFEARFGFRISKHTLYLIKNAVKMNIFEHLSRARLFTELELILKEEARIRIFERLDELSIISVIHSGIVWKNLKPLFQCAGEVIRWYELLYTGQHVSAETVYFLCLFDCIPSGDMKVLVKEFGITGSLGKKIIEAKSKAKATIERMKKTKDDSDFYFILNELSAEVVLYLMAKGDDEQVRRAVSVYFTKQAKTQLFLKGDDLTAMGYVPSPLYSDIMQTLLREHIRGSVKTREDEIRLVKERFPLN